MTDVVGGLLVMGRQAGKLKVLRVQRLFLGHLELVAKDGRVILVDLVRPVEF